MKRTFNTTLPDQAGAFRDASRCIAQLGLNITRVNYNKAIDTHMLFLEVEGTEEQLHQAAEELHRLGYFQEQTGQVLLLEFSLPNEPGALAPILELISRYNFNISYISCQDNGEPVQPFKMGLFIEEPEAISRFMQEGALLCPIRVVDYSQSEKVLDNTVFYLSFAQGIAEKMNLGPKAKRELIIQSNRIMQTLDERSSPFYKTFDYIARIADFIHHHQGKGYQPRISKGVTAAGLEFTLIEPPCGSNTCILPCGDGYLCFDSGFTCYKAELLSQLRQLYPDWDEKEKLLCLTHGDVDHCGCVDLFDACYVNRTCQEHFRKERAGEPSQRDENPLHAPYAVISKLLSAYEPPAEKLLHVFNDPACTDDGKKLLFPIGTLNLHDLSFEVFEGRGGHVAGEMIFIEHRHRLVFTGDIFVNIKGFSKDQARFNRLAPYLMTSVDTDPPLAKLEREALLGLLPPGHWQIIGGHGGVYEYEAGGL